MRKLLIFILSMLFITYISIPLQANENFAKDAKGAYVMEYNSGNVVFSKNENERLYPASMTKMMGLILIYEAFNNHEITLDEKIQASDYAASMGGSQIFLKENESFKIEELLKAIVISSANDAMVVMAEKIAGSETNFVDKMNQKAKQLNLKNTHFTNSTGLHHNDHYSSPKDMAIISKALIEIGGDELLAITSTYDDYIREDSDNKFWLVNTNKLIRQYEGVDGLKTGYTSEAKSCIAVSAKRNNIRFIVVIMGASNSKIRNSEVKELLDYSFSLFDYSLLYKKGKKLDVKAIEKSKQNKIELFCEEDVYVIYKKGTQIKISSQEIEWLNRKLPYKPNSRIAKVKIELNNGDKITSYLVNKNQIDEQEFIDVFMKAISISL